MYCVKEGKGGFCVFFCRSTFAIVLTNSGLRAVAKEGVGRNCTGRPDK